MTRPTLSLAVLARAGYALLILAATLYGLRLELNFGMALDHLRAALSPTLVPRDVVDAARNLALFAGWGVVWMITAPPRDLARSVLAATLTGLVLSVAIEAVQLFSRVRDASVLDVVTNTLGTLLGAASVLVLIALLLGLRERRSFVGVPSLVFAGAYGIAALLEALMPMFRQERVPDAWGGPAERLAMAVEFARSGAWHVPLLDALLFLPAGFFMVAAAAELGARYRSAAVITAMATPTVLALVQLGRALMGYPIEPGAFVVHAIAVAAGAALAAAALPPFTRSLRGRHRPLGLLVVYAIVLMFWSWRPFVLEPDVGLALTHMSAVRLVPLQSLFMRVDMFSVAVVGVHLLLFVPLGALLAVWPLRRRGPLAHLLPVLYLAVVLELGQIIVAGAVFDVTDLILRVIGAAVAWLLVRRTGYPVYGELLVLRRRGS